MQQMTFSPSSSSDSKAYRGQIEEILEFALDRYFQGGQEVPNHAINISLLPSKDGKVVVSISESVIN